MDWCVCSGRLRPWRIAILLTASAIAGIAFVPAPTDAFAKKGTPAAHAAARTTVVVPDINIPADRVPRRTDCVIFDPVSPCY